MAATAKATVDATAMQPTFSEYATSARERKRKAQRSRASKKIDT
jgi:hypothetical protein